MDLYHCQIVEGDPGDEDPPPSARRSWAHIQIAGVPQRHEPDRGRNPPPYLFELLDRLGYEGWIGCEYRPARGAVPGGTSDGLGWLRPYLAWNCLRTMFCVGSLMSQVLQCTQFCALICSRWRCHPGS